MFFGKFGVTPVFRFALLLYYRRFVVRLLTPVKIWSLEDHWNSLLHSALRPKPCLLFFSNLKLFNFGHFHYSVKHQLGYIILWILCVNFCVVCSFLLSGLRIISWKIIQYIHFFLVFHVHILYIMYLDTVFKEAHLIGWTIFYGFWILQSYSATPY